MRMKTKISAKEKLVWYRFQTPDLLLSRVLQTAKDFRLARRVHGGALEEREDRGHGNWVGGGEGGQEEQS